MRALFYLVLFGGLAWMGLRLYETGELPFLGERIEDAKTLGAIRAALALDDALSSRSITVRVRKGVATLSGEVASSAERAAAEELVANLDGVTRVENFIAVTPDLPPRDGSSETSLGQRLDDVGLSAKVKAALALHKELRNYDIAVEVRAGTVTLKGYVPGTRVAQAAGAWVARVRGVVAVENELAVGESTIEARIEEALAENEHLQAYALRAERRGGVVVLQGDVRTGAERELAERVAQDAAEGTALENAIRVSAR